MNAGVIGKAPKLYILIGCAHVAGNSLRDEVAVGMKGAWRSLTGSMRAPEVLQLVAAHARLQDLAEAGVGRGANLLRHACLLARVLLQWRASLTLAALMAVRDCLCAARNICTCKRSASSKASLAMPFQLRCHQKESTITSSLDMVLRSMRRRFLCDSMEERVLSSAAVGDEAPLDSNAATSEVSMTSSEMLSKSGDCPTPSPVSSLLYVKHMPKFSCCMYARSPDVMTR